MADSPSVDAWNNFVMLSEPSRHEIGSSKWSAAIANQYMGGANNGGINSFLTNSWELDASMVLAASVSIGALEAAQELDRVLRGLGVVRHFEIRVTPAMAAGVTDKLWSMEDIAELVDAAAPKPGRPATYKKRETA